MPKNACPSLLQTLLMSSDTILTANVYSECETACMNDQYCNMFAYNKPMCLKNYDCFPVECTLCGNFVPWHSPMNSTFAKSSKNGEKTQHKMITDNL